MNDPTPLKMLQLQHLSYPHRAPGESFRGGKQLLLSMQPITTLHFLLSSLWLQICFVAGWSVKLNYLIFNTMNDPIALTMLQLQHLSYPHRVPGESFESGKQLLLAMEPITTLHFFLSSPGCNYALWLEWSVKLTYLILIL